MMALVHAATHSLCCTSVTPPQFHFFLWLFWLNKKPCAVPPVSCIGDILWRQALLKSCGCGVAPQDKEVCNNSIQSMWAWDVIRKTINQCYDGIDLCCDQCCYRGIWTINLSDGLATEEVGCPYQVAGIGYAYGMAIWESRRLQLSLRWLKRPLKRQNWSSNRPLLPKSVMLWLCV